MTILNYAKQCNYTLASQLSSPLFAPSAHLGTFVIFVVCARRI